MNKLMMMAMVAAMGVAGSVSAATSIGYAGQLRDAEGGKLEEKSQTVTFKLYKEPTGGSALWSVERAVCLSDEGYFNVELDDDDKNDTMNNGSTLDDVLEQNETLYIGLTPKNSTEIAPRQKILCTPHATVATVAKVAKTGSDGFTVSGTSTMTCIQAELIKLKADDNNYHDLLPKGVIVMWSGAANEVPKGWTLCNGDNGTPDLRGRFIVGATESGDTGVAEDRRYKVNDFGGENKVTLTEAQMPSHSHEFVQDGNAGKVSGYQIGEKLSESGFTDSKDAKLYKFQTKENGENVAHENRPPYFALCYIMKL